MDNKTNNLPKVWGQGAIFAYSGLDGINTLSNSLAGILMADKIGIEFKTPVTSYLFFKLNQVTDIVYEIIANDVIKSTLINWNKEHHDFNITFYSENVLLLKCCKNTNLCVDFDEELTKRETDAASIYENEKVKFAICETTEGSTVKIAFAYGKNAEADAKQALLADFDAIVQERLAFYNTLPKAVFKDDDEAMLFNKCFSVMKSIIYTPEGQIKTRWSTPNRYPHKRLWLWDSAFNSVGLKYISKDLAEDAVRAVFSAQGEDGFIPHMTAPQGHSDITQAPVLAWAVVELYREFQDDALAKELYDKLEAYLMWDMKMRDENGNGLLEWEVDPTSADCRCGESGMDNTPRFDHATMADCIDFSSFMANEMRCMKRLAEILKKDEDVQKWGSLYNKTKGLINSVLWDEEDQFYYDKRLTDESFVKVKSVASFLPLFAGVATKEQAAALVEHLKNPQEFGTKFMIPTVSASDATYKTMDMFRGTVWLNFNYLIAQGLDEYGYFELADEIRESTIETVKKWYMSDGVIYEFYDSRDKVAPRRLSRKGHAIQPYLSNIKLQSVRDFSWGACFIPDFIIKRGQTKRVRTLEA